MARLFLVVAAALILTGAASAATIDDLRAMGYSVEISAAGTPGCPTYFISGHGVTSYFSGCDQTTIDSYANPGAVCNADWNTNHPDQVDAWLRLSQKGWSITGDQCADVYTVANPNDGKVAYSGSGSGLPGFNATHDAPPAAVTSPGTPNSAPVVAPTPNCLPLCPTSPTGPAPTTTTIATPTSTTSVSATSAIAPSSDPVAAPLVAAILFPDLSAGFLLRAGYGYDGALAVSP